MKTKFDKRNFYTEQLEEKIIELKRLCHMEKIPMFITVCVANNEKQTIYEKEMLSSTTCNCELTDDQIAKHVNVSLGFDTIQPSAEVTLEMDDMEINYIKTEEGENDDE